jgi:6-phosphogluconate dehydrogenase
MQLGMIGVGRMGANMTRRLMRHGHEVVVYDVNAQAVESFAGEGAVPSVSPEEFVGKLRPPRAAWIMVPAAFVGSTVDQLGGLMEPGDTIIDGGNSFYRDDVERSEALAPKGISYVDVGTSGGVFGLERGFCLMIGGERAAYERLEPIFASLAPGVDAATERTPGREGDPSPEEQGYLYCGPSGAGHFVKMVHNGIEYGMMASLAEGLSVIRHANAGSAERAADAETAPLRDPRFYRYEMDIPAIAEVWRRGSVVASWLLDLTAAALVEDPALRSFGGVVSDSGEGRWTIAAAVDEGVPVNVLTSALFDRFSSQGGGEFANKLLSAMRKQFGGHAEKPPAGEGG